MGESRLLKIRCAEASGIVAGLLILSRRETMGFRSLVPLQPSERALRCPLIQVRGHGALGRGARATWWVAAGFESGRGSGGDGGRRNPPKVELKVVHGLFVQQELQLHDTKALSGQLEG